MMRVAVTVVFAVPSLYFDESEKMFGDERFLSKKRWRELINESNADIITDAGFHLLPFKKRILRITKNPKMVFAPKAMHLFIIRERKEL
jgi:hypothetical protein